MSVASPKQLALFGLALFAGTAFGLLLSAPAHAETDGAAMSLSVDPADTVPCPAAKQPEGAEPMFCVPVDHAFTVEINADAVPTTNGYVVVNSWVHYGDELGWQILNGAVKDFERIWPDFQPNFLLTNNSNQTGDARLDSIGFSDLGSFFFPSSYKGVIFTFDLTCTTSPSNHLLDLVAFDNPPAGTGGSVYVEASTGLEIIPAVTGLEVNCVEPAVGGVALGDGLAPLGPASAGVSAWWFAAGALAFVLAASVGALAFVRRPR